MRNNSIYRISFYPPYRSTIHSIKLTIIWEYLLHIFNEPLLPIMKIQSTLLYLYNKTTGFDSSFNPAAISLALPFSSLFS